MRNVFTTTTTASRSLLSLPPLFLLLLSTPPSLSAATPPGTCSSTESNGFCGPSGGGGGGAARWYDISCEYKPGLVLFNRPSGLPTDYRYLGADMNQGSNYFLSVLHMEAHTGTHLDAPAHFVKEEYEGGYTVEQIPLDVLMGPVFVAELPPGVVNITGADLRALNIPPGCERLILKTDNTRRGLMHKTEFAPDYSALTKDGATYVAEHTQLKMIGIDFLSIATIYEGVGGHVPILKKHIIPVEGLVMDEVAAAQWYHLTCLHLKFKGADGSPVRCLLYGPVSPPTATATV